MKKMKQLIDTALTLGCLANPSPAVAEMASYP